MQSQQELRVIQIGVAVGTKIEHNVHLPSTLSQCLWDHMQLASYHIHSINSLQRYPKNNRKDALLCTKKTIYFILYSASCLIYVQVPFNRIYTELIRFCVPKGGRGIHGATLLNSTIEQKCCLDQTSCLLQATRYIQYFMIVCTGEHC